MKFFNWYFGQRGGINNYNWSVILKNGWVGRGIPLVDFRCKIRFFSVNSPETDYSIVKLRIGGYQFSCLFSFDKTKPLKELTRDDLAIIATNILADLGININCN